jgi:nucleoid-associated protein YgaU
VTVSSLVKAKFKVYNKDGSFETVDVQYNPSSLSFEKSSAFAEIATPGLDAPLRQFVRGLTETMTVTLFFDTTETGTGTGARSVTEHTDKFYGLVKIDPKTHQPPVCTFIWGASFPGDSLIYESQRRTEFKGRVTRVKQDFALFSPQGTPLRATLTVTLEEDRTLAEQILQLNLQSADHTRSHVVAEGDTLASVAWQYLQRPTEWRHLADANAIYDPRRLAIGGALVVPPVTEAVR